MSEQVLTQILEELKTLNSRVEIMGAGLDSVGSRIDHVDIRLDNINPRLEERDLVAHSIEILNRRQLQMEVELEKLKQG